MKTSTYEEFYYEIFNWMQKEAYKDNPADLKIELFEKDRRWFLQSRVIKVCVELEYPVMEKLNFCKDNNIPISMAKDILEL